MFLPKDFVRLGANLELQIIFSDDYWELGSIWSVSEFFLFFGIMFQPTRIGTFCHLD